MLKFFCFIVTKNVKNFSKVKLIIAKNFVNFPHKLNNNIIELFINYFNIAIKDIIIIL